MAVCNFCLHPQRLEMERAIAERRMTQQEAAEIVGVDRASVSRHFRNHFKKGMRDLMAKNADTESALNVVSALTDQYMTVRSQLDKAIEKGKISDIMLVLKEGRKSIELMARMTGQWRGPSTQVNLLMNPEFIQLKETILAELDPADRARLSLKLNALADKGDQQAEIIMR
jgi:DNA-binding MarR family transcriptional regulator